MVVTQIVDYKADFFDFVGLTLNCKWTHRYAEECARGRDAEGVNRRDGQRDLLHEPRAHVDPERLPVGDRLGIPSRRRKADRLNLH